MGVWLAPDDFIFERAEYTWLCRNLWTQSAADKAQRIGWAWCVPKVRVDKVLRDATAGLP